MNTKRYVKKVSLRSIVTCIYVRLYFTPCVGTLAVGSLLVGDVIRRTLDANPSLCLPNPMTTNATDAEYTSNDAKLQFDYPDCPASVDIAITMTFVYAMFMVGTYKFVAYLIHACV